MSHRGLARGIPFGNKFAGLLLAAFIAGCTVTPTDNATPFSPAAPAAAPSKPGVAVLLVDTDHPAGQIDERIYGHFLEEINHSTVDGLYAEQIRGMGFEGNDFA